MMGGLFGFILDKNLTNKNLENLFKKYNKIRNNFISNIKKRDKAPEEVKQLSLTFFTDDKDKPIAFCSGFLGIV